MSLTYLALTVFVWRRKEEGRGGRSKNWGTGEKRRNRKASMEERGKNPAALVYPFMGERECCLDGSANGTFWKSPPFGSSLSLLPLEAAAAAGKADVEGREGGCANPRQSPTIK